MCIVLASAFPLSLSRNVCYTGSVVVPVLETERGCESEMLQDFLVSVTAQIVAYYLCKWLDGLRKNDD